MQNKNKKRVLSIFIICIILFSSLAFGQDPELNISNNSSETGTTTDPGNSSITYNVDVSEPKKVYLLYEDNIVNSNDITITSEPDTDISITVEKPSGPSSLGPYTTPYTLTLDESILTEKGNYVLNATFSGASESVIKEFSVAEASIYLDRTEAEIDEEVHISISIDSPVEKITSIIMDFDDGASNIDNATINTNTKTADFYHKYQESGTYTPELITIIAGESFSITKNGISVESYEDTEDPTVTLLQPGNNIAIGENKITFSYKATDNSKVENCTFELYNYSGGFGTLDYTTTKTDVVHDEKIEIALKDFQEGDYSWNVFCCDNSSNCNADLEYNRDFTVSLNTTIVATTTQEEEETDHEKKQEIQDLLTKIDAFLVKTESSTLEEKNALEELEIPTNLIYYKKRLTQIDQDLGNNLKYVTDDLLREQRRSEILQELEEIKAETPINLEIISQNEYVKNSIAENLEEIISDYMEAKKTSIEKKSLKKLAELNYKIQNYITVTTNVRQIRITYSERTEELTLVSKKISIKNKTSDRILEVIPKEIANKAEEVTFITEHEVIKEDPIFEVSLDDLKEEKMVYYIKKPIDPKEIEKTETILFKEVPIEIIGITGFFLLEDTLDLSIYTILIIVLIAVVIYLAFLFINKRKIAKWKKEENVVKVFSLMKGCNNSIKTKDFGTAKEKYHKIKELYPLLPLGCKKYLNKKIGKIRTEIDKKDIYDLMKEYENAKTQGRKEDAQMIYKQIQSTYTRLPRKYKEKVYNKMFKPQTPENYEKKTGPTGFEPATPSLEG